MSVVGAALPEGAERRTYDVTGGPLVGWAVEPADPRGTALLVPGFTGSKEDFALVLPALADGGWRAVSLDQRGQHESSGPDSPHAYAVDALATDLLAVVDLLGAPVHLVGHSFGGLVARAAVLQRAEAFASLVLMGSGPSGLTGPRREAMQHGRTVLESQGLEAVADLMDAVAAMDERRGEEPDELRAFLRSRLLASSAAGLLAMGDALLGEPDRVAELRAAGLPVLVLHGEHDDAWSPAVQRAMAEELGARYDVVRRAWHSPAAEQPEATAAALLDFWAQLPEL